MSIGLATKGILSTVSAVGGAYPEPVPGCPPDQETDVVGQIHLEATIIEEDIVDVTPGVFVDVLPDPVDAQEVLPTMQTYPLPKNL